MSNNFKSQKNEIDELNEDDIKDEMYEDEILKSEIDEDEDEINIDEDIDENDEDDEIINSINFEESESELDIYFKYGTNNHKLDGKHSLKRDTIFNGKLADPNENLEEIQSYGIMNFEPYDMGDVPIERGSFFEEESRNSEDLQSKRKLAEDVYYLLKEKTDLDFRSNRRKPNKATFNNYYKMLLQNIDSQYTKSEIFVELAYYFTDNIFNMYKLLDKKYATIIIMELREKGFLNNLNNINFM